MVGHESGPVHTAPLLLPGAHIPRCHLSLPRDFLTGLEDESTWAGADGMKGVITFSSWGPAICQTHLPIEPHSGSRFKPQMQVERGMPSIKAGLPNPWAVDWNLSVLR